MFWLAFIPIRRRFGDMSLVSEDGEADGNGKVSPVVVVGVKFDAESRELLTWALVKVAQPGDRVVALHVLNRVIGRVL